MFKKLLYGFACAAMLMLGSVPAGAATDSEGYPVIYLRGSFDGSNWSCNDAYRFTRSGDLYTLTVTAGNPVKASRGDCQFKIGTEDWNLCNLGGNFTINNSQYVDLMFSGGNLKTNGLTDAVISFIYKEGEGATVKFVVDGVEPQLPTDPDPDPDPDYPAVYLRGDFNGTNWMMSDDRYKFKYADGKYTLDITSANPITAGSSFKIGTSDWHDVDLGAPSENYAIDNSQVVALLPGGPNLTTKNGITDGSISFLYPYPDGRVNVTFTVAGTDPLPPTELSGTLPVLYINVYTDKDHTAYNNEVISKDLAHKNYFEFAEYWLDVNGCQWLIDEGAENVGSAEKPLALQIKARGNYTRIAFAKKPFKLKLDKKQSLLGMSKSKHYAILAHADDTYGYLRNFTGFNLGKRISLPWTPSQQPVEVVINGDYRGLYFLTESIRVEEDRVNITELDDNVSDGTLVSGGYIVELDNYDEDDDAQIRMYEKTAKGSGDHYVDMLRITFDTPEVYSDLQRRFITDQFTAMNDYVGANSDNLWSYMDLDDAARYYLVKEILSDVESYHGSTYLFRDHGEGQKWHFSPLWDFGNAFNGKTDQFFYNCDPFGNTWIPSMRVNNTFNNKVKETWLWFMSNEYEGLEEEINTYVEHLKEAAKADRNRWKSAPVPGGGQSVVNNTDMDGKKDEALGKLNRKIDWLKGQFGDYTRGTYSEPSRDTTPAAELPDYAKPTSSIEESVIGSDELWNGDAQYYNLQGMKVANPESGNIYIRVAGTKAQKVIVK